MGRLLGLVLALSACKAELAGGADGGVRSLDGRLGDAAQDAGFGAPMKHPSASDPALNEDDGSLRADGLEMVFAVQIASDGNLKDLYTTSRASLADPWTPATRLTFSVAGVSDETPRFSTDGLTLYFASGRAGGQGNLDIYSVSRVSVNDPWNAPTPVTGPNSAALEKWYMPCATTYLVIRGGDIAEGPIGGAPTVVTALSDAATNETGPFLTNDCLTAYFASPRDGVSTKIYTATRASIGAAWSAPVAFTELAALGGDQEDPWLSPDGTLFSLVSDVAGTKDQYLVTR